MTKSKIATALGAVLLLALPLLPVPEFWITQLDYIGLYAMVVLGLVLLTGVAGLTSFGQAAFVGVGAYATAYATTAYGASPWLGLLCGVALTLVVALVVAGVTLRMSGHYLPLATIAWGLAMFFLVGNLEFLGKFDGLQGIPPVSIAGVELRSGRASYFLIWIVALLGALALRHLLDSRPGRAIRALKGGTLMAEAMGIATLRYKVLAFVIAAVYASLSGWLFAHYQRSVNPSPFGLQMGIEYLFMAVLGGVGLVGGAFVGAAAVKIAEDQLQNWLPALLNTSGAVELVVFGMVLILVLQVTPDGLWSLVTRRLPVRRQDPSDWAGAQGGSVDLGRCRAAAQGGGASARGDGAVGAEGAQAVRRPGRGQRRRLRGARRRDRRPDRPERRRQVDAVQPDRRCLQADRRQDHFRRRGCHRAAGGRALPARHRAHFSGREKFRDHDRDRQCHCRRADPDHRDARGPPQGL